MCNIQKTGSCLTGGGGIGTFHIGFFKALEKMGVNYNLVCGSSVGALVGGASTYMSSEEMFEAWKILTLESVFKIDSKKIVNHDGYMRFLMLYKECLKSCFRKDPNYLIDFDNIRSLLYKQLDGDKIRDSKIDFGVTTTHLPSFELRKYFKEDMKVNPLEYILASIYLPVFSRQSLIDNQQYLDLARFRKYPFSMLKEKGCRNIIIVNIELNNIKKLLNNINNTFVDGEKVIFINYDKKPSILDFSEGQAEINYERGYEDSLKVLEKAL